jgi:NAD(P)-dependent dehydrogenase (short-subunit alcohol dehydrogenase family)
MGHILASVYVKIQPKMATVLITGVTRGIGKATAEKFSKEGWGVIGTSTSGEKGYQLDLAEPSSIESLANELEKAGQVMDVLINNAAVSLKEDLSTDNLRATLEVNLIGLIDLTERLLSRIKDGGHIINISSQAGSLEDFDTHSNPSYKISKTALNMYTKVLAARLENRRIRVSSLDPGWVKTDMGGSSAPRDPKEAAEDLFKLVTSEVESGHFWHKGKKRSW